MLRHPVMRHPASARSALRRALVASTALVGGSLGIFAGVQAQIAPGALPDTGAVVFATAGLTAGATTPANAFDPKFVTSSSKLDVGLNNNFTVLTWGRTGFNVGSAATVRFNDTRAAITGGPTGQTANIGVLNRDTSGVKSEINGKLFSDPNVAVYVLNSQGVLFGAGATVNVGALVAGSLDLNAAQQTAFLSGATNLQFTGPLALTKGVTFTGGGSGSISTVAGAAGLGQIVLLGAFVDSQGTLAANGDVALVAATDVSVAMAAGSPLSITINKGTSVLGPIVAKGSIGGVNVVFAAANAVDTVLDIEAVVTATTAAATDRGIVLVAGPSAAANPAVTITADASTNGVIAATLGGSLTATGTGGGVTLLTSGAVNSPGTAATLSASKAVSVRNAAGNITLGAVSTGGGTASVVSDAGTVTLASLGSVGAATVTGKALTLGAVAASAGGVTLNASTGGIAATTVSGGGAVALTAGGTVQATSASGTVLTINGAAITLGSAQATLGNAVLTSTTGAIQLGTATTGGDLRLNGVTSASVTGAVTSGADYRIAAKSVVLGDGSAIVQAAGGAVDITASAGSITGTGLLTLRANSGGVAAVAGNSLRLDATGGNISFAATSILQGGPAQQSDVGTRLGTAASTLTLGAVSARVLGTVNAAHTIITGLTNDAAILFGGPVNTANALSITTTGGGSFTGGSVTSGNTLGIDAAGVVTATTLSGANGLTVSGSSITLGTAGASAGAAALTATIGAIQLGSAATGGDLGLNAFTSAAVTGAVTAGGAYRITAKSAALGDGSSIVQAAAGGIDITTSAGAITGAGLLTLRANSDGIGAENLVLDATGGGIDFAATSILQGGPTRQSDVGIRLGSAATALALGAVTARRLGGIDAAHTLITGLTNDAAITLRGAVGTANALSITTTGGGTVTATTVNSSDTLSIVAAGAIVATGLTGTNGLTLTGPTINVTTIGAAAGAAVLTSTIGALQIANGSVGTANLGAATNLGISGTLAATGNVTMTANGSFAGGSATSGGTLGLTTGAAITATTLSGANGLTVSGSSITLGTAGASAGAAALTATIGAIQLGSAATGGDLGLNAFTSAAVTGAVTAGGAYRITAKSAALGDGSSIVQAAAGGIDITTSAGAITGAGLLTLRANSDGIGAENLVLDATGGGIDFAATSILQGGPTRQSDVGIRLGSAATALALGAVTARRLGGIDAGHTIVGQLNNDAAITFGGAVLVTNALAMTTTAGDITTAAINVTGTGQTLDLTTQGAGTSITSSGLLSAAGSVALAAAKNLGFGDARSTGGNVSAVAGTGRLDAVAIHAAWRAFASAATSAVVGTLVSGSDIAAADRSATITADSVDVGTVQAGTNLTLTALNGPLTLGGGTAGDTATLTKLGLIGALTITGSFDVGTNSGSAGAFNLATDTDARLAAVRNLTGDIGLSVSGQLTGLSDGAGGFNAANLSAASAGHDIGVNAGGTIKLGDVTAGRDIFVAGNGAVEVIGAVSAGGSYAVTGGTVTLGSGTLTDQRAAGSVQIRSTTGVLIGQSGLTLTSDSDGVGGGDLILRSVAGIGVADTLLVAGPARQSAVRIGLAPGAALLLGQVDARTLVSYDAALTATSLEHDGQITAARITVAADLIIGNTLAGRPAALTLGAATSLGGNIGLGTAGALAAATGSTDLTASGTVTTASASAALGTVNAGSAIDARTTGDLVVAASSAGATTTLAAGNNLRLGVAGGAGTITLTAAGDITGLSNGVGGFGRAAAASTGGGIAITANGASAATGLVSLGAVEGVTGVTVTGRQLDIDTVTATVGGVTLQARELAASNEVSLTVASANAVGAVQLTSGLGTGGSPTANNGNVVVTSAASSGSDVVVTARDGAVTGTGSTGAIFGAGNGSVTVITGTLARIAAATARTDIAVTAGDSGSANRDGRIDITSATTTDGAITLAAFNDNAAAAAGIVLETGSAGGDAAVTTTGTRGDIAITALTAGTRVGSSATATIAGVANARLASVISVTGGVAVSGVAVTGTAASPSSVGTPDAGFNRANLVAAGSVDLTATGLGQIGNVTAGSGAVLTAARLDVDSVAVSAGAMALTATGTDLRLGTGTASAAATIIADNGTTAITSVSAGTALLVRAATITIGHADAAAITTISSGASQVTDALAGGAFTANAGTSYGFGTVGSSGGNAVITAGGAVTGTLLTAAQAIGIDAGSIDIAAVNTGTALTTTSGGATRFGTAGAGGNASVTTGNTLDFNSLTSSGGNILLAVGSILTGTTLTATTGAIGITAASLQLAAVTAGTTLTSVTTGASEITTALAGGNIDLRAGSTLGFGSITSTTGNAKLQANGAITGTSLTAAETATANGGTVTITTIASGAGTVLGSAGAIDLGTVVAGSSIAATAGTTIDFVSVKSNTGAIGLTAGGAVKGTTLDAATAVSIDAASIDVTTLKAGTTLTTKSSGLTKFGTATAGGDIGVTAGGFGFDTVSSASGGATITVAGATTGNRLDTGQAILIDSGSAALGMVNAGTALTINSGTTTDITTGTSGGAMLLTAGTGLGFGSLTSGGNAGLVGTAVTGTTLAAAGDITIAGGSIAVTGTTAGGTLTTTSSGATTLGTVQTGGDVLLTMGTSLDYTAIGSSGGSIGFTAGGAVTGATTTAANAINGNGASLALTTTNAGTGLTLASTAGNITSGSAIAGGDAVVTAVGGDIVSGDLTSTAGSIRLVADGAVRSTTTNAARGITVTAGPLAKLDSVRAGDALIIAATQVTLGIADAGSLSLTAGGGGTTIDQLSTRRDIAITSGAGITINRAISDAGNLTATATGAIDAATLAIGGSTALTGAAITATSITAASLDSRSTGATQLTSVTTRGDILANAGTTLGFGSLDSGASIDLTAGDALAGTTLKAASAIIIDAASINATTLTAGTTLTTKSGGATKFGTATSVDDAFVTTGTMLDFNGLASDSNVMLIVGSALTGTTLSAGGFIDIGAGSLQLGTVSATSRLFSRTSGASQFAQVGVVGDIDIRAGTVLDFGRIASDSGSANLRATGAVSGTSLTAGAAIDVNGGSIDITTIAAGIFLPDNVTLGSAGAITVGTVSAGGFVSATAGTMIDFGSIISGGGVGMIAGGAVAGTTLNGRTGVSIDAASIDVTTLFARFDLTTTSSGLTKFGTANVGGDIVVTAGRFDFDTVTSTGGGAVLTVGGATTGNRLDTSKTILIDSGSLALGLVNAGTTLTSTTGTTTDITTGTSGGAMLLAAGTSLGFGSLTSGGNAGLAGTAITGTTLAAAGDITAAGGSIAISGTTAGATLTTNSSGATTLGTVQTGGDMVATAGDRLGLGTVNGGGALLLTATGALVGDSLTAVGSLDASAASIAITSARIGTTLKLASTAGGIGLGSGVAGSDATVAATGGDVTIGDLASTAGAAALTATGAINAGSVTAGNAITATGTAIGVDSADAGSTLALTATAGGLRLGTARSGAATTLVASGAASLTGAVASGADFAVTATSVDLAPSQVASQTARGAVQITATSGAITGGGGLTLAAGSGALTLKALGGSGAIRLAPSSALSSAGGDVGLSATGIAELGSVTAVGHAVTVSAADAALGGAIKAAQITLVDSAANSPVRLGDTPIGNETEFAATPTPRFELSSAEIARLETAALVIDARAQSITIGAMPVNAATGATTFALRTSGRVDVLGRFVAMGSATGRIFSFGGDGTGTGKASVIRIAATPGGGGRMIADGATITLNGDRIGAGYDANLLGALALTPGAAAPPSADEVAARFVSQPSSALYAGNFNGQPFYTDAVLISSRSLVVNYGRYALFQNTGQPGLTAGVILGAAGASALPPALNLNASAAAIPNAFAVFGTINGINGAATSLLGPDGITIGGPVSRGNARANGCLIGSSGGGCLSASLAQPVLILFESKSEIFRISDNLALPFDPLVGTSNEALFSDIAGIDIPADDAPCPAGDPASCDEQGKPK